MNKSEAIKILELSSNNPSDEDIKKQYKSLVKKWHPDSNKDPSATEKIKNINEAFNYLKNNNNKQEFYIPQDITLSTTISFKESVLGTKKDISYKRDCKCSDCNGTGFLKNKNCKNCNGDGIITHRQGNTIFTQTCFNCYNFPKNPCGSCSQGRQNVETALSISIPPGILNYNILRLQNMGNYIGNNLFGEYTDVYLQVQVTQEPNMQIVENNVVSRYSIPLLDALKGSTLTVNTIDGPKDVNVPPKSKNNDQVIIPKLGVNYAGDHVIKLTVDYPEDVSQIIKILESNAI